MADNIDVDVGGIIRGDCTMTEASDRLKAAMHEVAEGRLTCAERHGDLEISISRVDVAFLRHRAQGRTL
jgi:altronate dehydratase large subunit